MKTPGPKPAPPESRRKFERFPIDLRVTAHVFREGKTVSVWGRSTELGVDGIGVTLTGALETDEVVTLELTLPLAPKPLKIRALVRFHNGLRHGLEFLAITPDQRNLVKRVCEMLAAGQ